MLIIFHTGRLGEMLNLSTMFRWCSQAFIQGLVAFVVTMRMISGDATRVQKDFQIYVNGPGGLMTTTGRTVIIFIGQGYTERSLDCRTAHWTVCVWLYDVHRDCGGDAV
jgi:magnesium-transporting ATPase (P-type)